jgi:hypothetical protein
MECPVAKDFDLESAVRALSARAAQARARLVSGSAHEALAELEQIRQIVDIATAIEDEFIAQARSPRIGERATWDQIGRALGISGDNAQRRYRTAGQSKKVERPGYSITEAASLTGMSRATINARIAGNAGAAWYTTVPTMGAKRTEAFRVLDLGGLRAAPARLGSGSAPI